MNEKNIQKITRTTNPPPVLLKPMCWFLLITIVAWLTIALFITVTLLYITHDPVNTSILAPLASPTYFLYRILKPMLPMDEKRFILSKMKIQKFPGSVYHWNRKVG